MNKILGFFSYFSFTKYQSCIIEIFCEFPIYLLFNCNMLTNTQNVADFVLFKKLSKKVDIANAELLKRKCKMP